jgi:hypothetical protein
MHEIEAELKKALKFKGKYEDRQELLTAILLAMDDRKRFTDKDYDALTDDAVSWFEAAVKAKDAGDEIPDFAGEFEDEDAEVDHEADEAAEFAEEEEAEDASDESDAEADDDGDVDEEDGNEAEEIEAAGSEPDEGGVENGLDEDPDVEDEPGDVEGESTEDEPEGPEDTEEQILKKAKKIAKQAPPPVPHKVAKPEVKAKPKAPARAKVENIPAKPKAIQKGTFPEPDYANISGKRNRFGVIDGTKTAEAIKMYVKGASSQDIMERLGGRYYNILKKLMAEGHKVEKEGSVWKLTHKDDVKTKKKVK